MNSAKYGLVALGFELFLLAYLIFIIKDMFAILLMGFVIFFEGYKGIFLLRELDGRKDEKTRTD